MLGYEADFILLTPERGGKMPVLVRVHFVVDGDRLNLYSGRGIPLEELDEILCKGGKPALAYGPAPHRSTGFHPSGRTPNGREQVKIRIEFPGLPQRGKNPATVMLNAELLQLRIRLWGIVVAVELGRKVTRPHAGSPHGQA